MFQHVFDPLFVDLFRPLRLKDEANCEVHEEITQRRRVEDAGIQNRGRHSYSPARCASAAISSSAADASCW